MEFLIYFLFKVMLTIGFIFAWIYLLLAVFNVLKFEKIRYISLLPYFYVIFYSFSITLQLNNLYNDVLWVFYGLVFSICSIIYLKSIIKNNIKLFKFSILVSFLNLILSLIAYSAFSEFVINILNIHIFTFINQLIATVPSIIILILGAYIIYYFIFKKENNTLVGRDIESIGVSDNYKEESVNEDTITSVPGKKKYKGLLLIIVTIILEGVSIVWGFTNGNSVFFDAITGIFILGVGFIISLVASLTFLVYLSAIGRRKYLAFIFFICAMLLNFCSFWAGSSYLQYNNQKLINEAIKLAPQAISVKKITSNQTPTINTNFDLLSMNTYNENLGEIRKYYSYDRQSKDFVEIPFLQNNIVFSANKTKFATIDNNQDGFKIYGFGGSSYWKISKTNDKIVSITPVAFSPDAKNIIIKLYGVIKNTNDPRSLQDNNPDSPYSAVQEVIGYSILNLENNSIQFIKSKDQKIIMDKFWPQLKKCAIYDMDLLYYNHIDPVLDSCSIDFKDKGSAINVPTAIEYDNKYYQTGVRMDTSGLYGWHSSKSWYYVVLQAGGNADDPEALFRFSKDNKKGVMVLNTAEKLGYGKTGNLIVLPSNDIFFTYSEGLSSKNNSYIFNEKDGLRKVQANGLELKIVWNGQPASVEETVLPSNAKDLKIPEGKVTAQSPYDSGAQSLPQATPAQSSPVTANIVIADLACYKSITPESITSADNEYNNDWTSVLASEHEDGYDPHDYVITKNTQITLENKQVTCDSISNKNADKEYALYKDRKATIEYYKLYLKAGGFHSIATKLTIP